MRRTKQKTNKEIYKEILKMNFTPQYLLFGLLIYCHSEGSKAQYGVFLEPILAENTIRQLRSCLLMFDFG